MSAVKSSEVSQENGCDETVTMVDVLENEKELEEDATAVLGASDDKNCTYLQVSVIRICFLQPLPPPMSYTDHPVLH